MKKTAIFLSVAFFAACNNTGHQASGLLSGSDSLLAAETQRISVTPPQNRIVNKTLRNLDTIEFSRRIIINKALETQIPSDERSAFINAEIARLNGVIAENNKQIAMLNELLKEVSDTEIHLGDSVMMLNEKLEDTKSALDDMKEFFNEAEEQYRIVDAQLANMVALNLVQSKRITALRDSLFYAYYIVKPESYLISHGIIRKENATLNMVRHKEFDPNAQNEEFVLIDQRKKFTIPIRKKNATLVTSHPDGSYRLEKNGSEVKRLIITNPQEFWRVSRYLVIAAK